MARFADVFALAVALIILVLGARHVIARWRRLPARRPFTAALGVVLAVVLGFGMARVGWALLHEPLSVRSALDLLFMNAGFLLGYGLTLRGDRP